MFLLAGGMTLSAFLLPAEDGYELIPDGERRSVPQKAPGP